MRLVDLDRLGVGGKNYVLVVHLHPGGEEIAGRIAKAHRIDNGHGRTVHFRAVDAKQLGEGPMRSPSNRAPRGTAHPTVPSRERESLVNELVRPSAFMSSLPTSI
jgi:hypothetical protein